MGGRCGVGVCACRRPPCALVVNNPSNPCRSVFSRQHLERVLAAAEDLRLPIIADEVYPGITFGRPFFSCAPVSPKVPILLTCALSKRWLAPGWRIGWVTAYDADGVLHRAGGAILNLCQISLGPSAPMQAAVPAIMQPSQVEASWHSGVLDEKDCCLHPCKPTMLACADCPCRCNMASPEGTEPCVVAGTCSRAGGAAARPGPRRVTEAMHAKAVGALTPQMLALEVRV